jgi:hypothetical protein
LDLPTKVSFEPLSIFQITDKSGLNMLVISASETQQMPDAEGSSTNSPPQPLARHLYIHGTQYVLRGLPETLANEEAVGLWSSLPRPVREVAILEAAAEIAKSNSLKMQQNAVTAPGHQIQPRGGIESRQRSGLHRLVAALTVYILLLVQFLAPYIRYFFSSAYELERKHQVTEKMLASGAWSIDQAAMLSDTVCRMNDGKVGKAIAEAVVWWIEGIMGGIQQGVGDGLTEMGLRR